MKQKILKKETLPKNTKGLVITEIANDSPINYLKTVNDIIVEAQKKAIKTIEDLEICKTSIKF